MKGAPVSGADLAGPHGGAGSVVLRLDERLVTTALPRHGRARPRHDGSIRERAIDVELSCQRTLVLHERGPFLGARWILDAHPDQHCTVFHAARHLTCLLLRDPQLPERLLQASSR